MSNGIPNALSRGQDAILRLPQEINIGCSAWIIAAIYARKFNGAKTDPRGPKGKN